MDYEMVNGVMMPAKPKVAEAREIATTADGRDITRGFIDSLPLLPPLDPVLASRGGSYEVYEELLRDDQVAACFRQLRLAVVGAEWDVDAGGKKRADKNAAASLKDQLAALNFDGAFDKMLYGVFYGYGVGECMWGTDGAQTTLGAIKVRKSRRFGFGPQGELKLLTSKDPLGEVMPPRKFWHFTYGGDTDDEPYGTGLAQALYWPVFFKRNGLKFWLIFLEKFGQPTAIGKYPNNALPDEKKRLLGALGAVHSDGGIIIPEGMIIELLEAARSGTADYSALCDRMDNAIAKVILGQTATTQGTPGKLGGDEAQSNVAEDLIKATSDLLCQSFNRGPARWLTEWNYPGAVAPKVWRQTEPPEDSNKRAERDSKVYQMGFKPTLEYVKKTYGDGWEPRTSTPATDVPGVLSETLFAENSRPSTAPELLADRMSAEAADAHRAWLEQIRQIVDTAQSLEGLRDALLNAASGLSDDEIAKVMQAGFAVADLVGRFDARDGGG